MKALPRERRRLMSDNITTDLVIGGEARPAASGIVYGISTPARPTAIGRNFGVDGVRLCLNVARVEYRSRKEL